MVFIICDNILGDVVCGVKDLDDGSNKKVDLSFRGLPNAKKGVQIVKRSVI